MILVILKCNKHTLNQDGHSPYPLPPKNYIQEVRWYDTIVLLNGPLIISSYMLNFFPNSNFEIFFLENMPFIYMGVDVSEKKMA